jgi:hypothetical protein
MMKPPTKPTIAFVNKKAALFVLFLAAVLFSCHKTSGIEGGTTTLTLQPALADGFNVSTYYLYDYSETPESTYVSPVPGENFNGDSIITVNNYEFESANAANILLQFDSLSAIPTTASVISATLYLYGIDSATKPSNVVYQFYGDGIFGEGTNPTNPGTSLLVQKITGSWNNTTVTWNTMPGTTDTGTNNLQVTFTARWNYNISADITEMAKEWVANPAANFGCRLFFTNLTVNALAKPQPFPGPYQQIQFYSSYATNAALRPKLVVEYK